METLENQLTTEFGGWFDFLSLYKYLRFYTPNFGCSAFKIGQHLDLEPLPHTFTSG